MPVVLYEKSCSAVNEPLAFSFGSKKTLVHLSLNSFLTARQKRMLNTNAFDNDINKCLFNGWTAYVGKINPHPGLRDRVKCKGKGLCYGADGNGIAQYAACYNQKTLIPEFTGHIVHPGIAEGGGREDEFVADTSIGNSN